jgi:hypothetical protein
MKRKKKSKGFRLSPAHASQGRLFGQTGAYLMGSIIYPFRNKWGISDRADLRRAQVDKDVTGPVYTVFCREVFFGWTCEQFVHFAYQWANAPIKKTTGGTEWYYNLNPVFGGFVLWLTWNYGIQIRGAIGVDLKTQWCINALAFLCPFVWIDGLLWLVFFRLLGWGLCAGVGYMLWVFITTNHIL